jgi:hypothetical protein
MIMNKYNAWIGLLAGSAIFGGLQAQDTGSQTATLKFKPYKSFDFLLPKETWTKVGSTVGLRHPNGEGFRAIRTGLKLTVDTTGNGNPNKDVKGSSGYLTFRSATKGNSFHYAARFQGSAAGFTYASSCAMVGTVAGVPIQLLDLNNNGRFDEVGTDGILVGKGKAVAFLSKVISYNTRLYNLTVKGVTVSTTPYAGEAGSINLTSGFQSRGKLQSAIISDGNNSYNVAGLSSLTVPVGDYKVVSGFVGKGPASAQIRAGKMAAIRVKDGEMTKLNWGGKVLAEFTCSMEGDKVTVAPANLHYYGRAGEEYYNLNRNAKSPRFTARDAESGRPLGNFAFAGC